MTRLQPEETSITAQPPPAPQRWRPHAALVAVLLAMAGLRMWTSPIEAGGRLIAPDGAEYAVSAHRLATLGTFDIDVLGTRHPIRYPPLFSVAMLAPVYAIAPGEIGNGIVVVQAFALLLIGGAYVVGHRIAGIWGAAAACGAVIGHDLLARFARTIMTDLPVAALVVAGLALFVHPPRSSRGIAWWAAGVVCALAAGLRPLAGCMLVPFLVLAVIGRRRVVLSLVALIAPSLILGAVNAWYNASRFGSWRRTGYHYWAAIPYEFPSLVFSPQYLWDNLLLFGHPWMWAPLAAGAVGIGVAFTHDIGIARRVTAYVAAAGLPISLAHLYYFHTEPRFHAPLIALGCVVGASAIVLLLPQRWRERPWVAVALAAAVAPFVRPPAERFGSSRPLIERFARYVPPGGTIITRIGPVHLDPLVLRPGGRHWLAAWRIQDYAGQAVTTRPTGLPVSAVKWPGHTHRQPAIFAAGARDAVPWTAPERLDLVAQRVAAGPGVYLDAATVPPGSEPYKQIDRAFVLRPVDPDGLVLQLVAPAKQREGFEPE